MQHEQAAMLNMNLTLAFVRPSLPDSKAITDGNLKLILGLIWTLILHYSISMPVWEGEDEEVMSKRSRLSGCSH